MAEESKDPGKQVPEGRQPRRARRPRRVRGHLGRRALGAAGPAPRRRLQRRAQTVLRTPRLRDLARRLLRKRPGARRHRTPRAARHGPETGQVLRRDPRRDDPVHRDQRGDDRHLAPVVVALRAPPAAADLLPAAREVPHAVVHADLLLDARRHADHLRQHRSARQPVLVRRDAVVHDRARGDRARCASKTPTASAPTARRGACASKAR